MASQEQTLLDREATARTVRRLASQISEGIGLSKLVLVGIRRGGEPLAEWLAREIEAAEGHEVPLGAIDIAFYRDDAASMLPDPEVGSSEMPVDIRGWDVVLVDDVLHTGRTVRAAMDCVLDFGRPRRIWLAVLVDRGGRELPISAEFIGRAVEVPAGMRVRVTASGSAEDAAILQPIPAKDDAP